MIKIERRISTGSKPNAQQLQSETNDDEPQSDFREKREWVRDLLAGRVNSAEIRNALRESEFPDDHDSDDVEDQAKTINYFGIEHSAQNIQQLKIYPNDPSS